MDQLRRAWAQIRSQLGKLGPTEKLLAASLVVIAAMTLFLVSRYAAKPTMVDVMAADPSLQLVQTLRAGGVQAEQVEGRVMVPEGEQRYAMAMLAQSGQLPDSNVVSFANLSEIQDWRNSRQINTQQYIFALQNELAMIISEFHGVRSASVVIDAPEPMGLGRVARRPSASVSVFSSSGGAVPQETVDAVARLVAGAVSGMEPTDVKVIDGTGRPRKVSTEDDMGSGDYLEQALQVEKQVQTKLEDLLSFIPGVVVKVSATVDVARRDRQVRRALPKGDGSESFVKTEHNNSLTEGAASRAAEPGVRSNQTADINAGSSASGTRVEETEDELTFENHVGESVERIVDARGVPTYLAATVHVPDWYFRDLVERSNEAAAEGGEPAAVTEAEVQARFEAMRPDLERSLRPHLTVRGSDGEVVPGEVQVSMVPMITPPGSAGAPAGGVMSTVNFLAGGDRPGGGGAMIQTAMVGLLAVVALVMMLMMVKRSAKKLDLPSAEELVGIPPRLQTDDDMVGEVLESESPLEAIEVDPDQVQKQKMLEQLGDLVQSDPKSAASLVRRWIEQDE